VNRDARGAARFLGVQKYGKKKCGQIFRRLFFHGKGMVINNFAAESGGGADFFCEKTNKLVGKLID
jgi:hypothetical protein